MEDIYSVNVENVNSDLLPKTFSNGNTIGNSINWNWDTWTYPNNTYPYFTTWPQTIYKYQIKCPKRTCKKMNWLELDKITPCTNCGAKLKAVSQTADFEIPIE